MKGVKPYIEPRLAFFKAFRTIFNSSTMEEGSLLAKVEKETDVFNNLSRELSVRYAVLNLLRNQRASWMELDPAKQVTTAAVLIGILRRDYRFSLIRLSDLFKRLSGCELELCLAEGWNVTPEPVNPG